jgi:hypothetical protein
MVQAKKIEKNCKYGLLPPPPLYFNFLNQSSVKFLNPNFKILKMI